MTTKFVIFDLNGCVAFFDTAKDPADAIRQLAAEDDSYADIDELRVHELDDEESEMLSKWIDDGQPTHEWPFDWRSLR